MATRKNISFAYTEYENQSDLESSDRDLLERAGKAALNAYAPYSKFRVGAALRLASGKIVTGTNIENAAFPSGICAERTAISNASSNFPGDKPVALAIAALGDSDTLTGDIVSPCGNCRQVIAEEELRNENHIRIILGSNNKIRVIENGGDLLPLQFSNVNLRSVRR
jgi:cytidine deaminase